MLELVKKACHIMDSAYNDELNLYMATAWKDLGNAGVIPEDIDDPVIKRAIVCYCKASIGSPADYDRLMGEYERIKGTLQSTTGYTDWGED